ncbi:Sorting nexin-14 [Apodemus speciosus]|uniref:Sorting nexin-14 n=1 Tax=Apodemus speciosus TaxID=105296 RepID=A0ABQ0F5E7_APOSI
MRTIGGRLKQRLRLDVGREICRQYPLFCFLLLCLSAASLLLNRQLGIQELFPQGHSCAVCGKVKCKRHRPSLLLENYQPWLDLKVLELVLENFVYPWYRDITDDESFVDELRITLRFFASVLVRRIHKVDIPSIITKKLLKAAMKHIEVIVKARQKVKNTEYLQQAALEEYGPELHVALRSRRDELQYLRKLTELLFPYILPPKATDCRSLTLLIREILSGSVFLPSLDFLADPDTVNHLLIIFIDDSPPEKATEPASPLVPFLQKFAEPRNKKPSVLKLELKQIREQQDLLFRFMNFLKQEGAVHVLQFCLTVEEFNDRILRPELSNDEMLSLHEELQKIYRTYCLDESIDKIRFDPFIVEEIQRIAEGPYIDVVKLQTMRCLFEAYEHVLSLLENVFTPMFCHSDEATFKRCRIPNTQFEIQQRSTQKRGESFGISRIGSKIKGVFKSTAMEGAVLPNYGVTEGEDDFIEEGIVVMEDDSPVEAVSTPNTPRNLAAWKISIPYVDFFEDPSSERKEKKERIPVFCIDVERNDRRADVTSTDRTVTCAGRLSSRCWLYHAEGIANVCPIGHEPEHWSVYRRYLEFYVLESKLTEFHGTNSLLWNRPQIRTKVVVYPHKSHATLGTFPDAQLPSKRIIGPKNYEFLKSKREEFQEYLQKLVQHPELSNSQLLADFLSPNGGETQFLDKILPDVNLGPVEIFREFVWAKHEANGRSFVQQEKAVGLVLAPRTERKRHRGRKIIKSVPGKLMKEKGQHLEPFIMSFINSCESPKPKPSRPELTILSPTSENNKKLFNDLFKNNANRAENTERKQNQNYFMEVLTVDGVYDYLMYVGRVVFQVPDWLHHLLMGTRILFKNTLEMYTDYYLAVQAGAAVPGAPADAIFCENTEPRSLQDKQKGAKQTFEEMMNYIPDLIVKCIGEETKYESIRLLFDGLQQPVLNKQLTYVLLDIVIQELFPELNKPFHTEVQKEATSMTSWM